MHHRLYFAYGSNLLPTRLAARCPSAQVHSVATAPGWSVVFTKPGGDGSGKAGLVSRRAESHPGVLYKIADAEIPDLDRFEGVGHGYTRLDNFAVTTPAGESICCSTYLPERHDPSLLPFDWYLALCIAGALEHGFPDDVVARFRATACQQHEQEDHPGRRSGIEALSAANHPNWQSLLAREHP